MSPTPPTPPAPCCSTSTTATGTTSCWASCASRAGVLPEGRGLVRAWLRTPSRRCSAHALPIAGIAGDQQAALFGQRCVAPGMVKNTYGTGCFMLMHTGERPVDSHSQLLTTIAWQRDGRARVCARRQHLRRGRRRAVAARWPGSDSLGRGSRSAGRLGARQRRRLSGAGLHRAGRAALGSLRARASWRASRAGSTAGHVARATLEAIAYQTADILAAMQADAGIALKELRVDGGATRNDLLMQFQADILGVPVVRPQMLESTAQGAAFLAGLGVGLLEGRGRDRPPLVGRARLRAGDGRRRSAPTLLAGWQRALERAKGWERSVRNTQIRRWSDRPSRPPVAHNRSELTLTTS